eukprot:Platyproteum_vivax@DN8282_c0_g1_i1.p1
MSDTEDTTETPAGNGGKTDKYVWTQTLGTVDIYIPLGKSVVGKDCRVEITPTSLKVGLKGAEFIIDGELHKRVKTDDSMWMLDAKTSIHIVLEKIDQMRWWSCVIQGDPEINTQKVQPENSKLGDLDAETRATVERMMYDQAQKQLGKPTSKESEQANILEQFKKQHPEMDFSQAKVNYGGSDFGR